MVIPSVLLWRIGPVWFNLWNICNKKETRLNIIYHWWEIFFKLKLKQELKQLIVRKLFNAPFMWLWFLNYTMWLNNSYCPGVGEISDSKNTQNRGQNRQRAQFWKLVYNKEYNAPSPYTNCFCIGINKEQYQQKLIDALWMIWDGWKFSLVYTHNQIWVFPIYTKMGDKQESTTVLQILT